MPDARQTSTPLPAGLVLIEPAAPAGAPRADLPDGIRGAARRVLARDGRDLVLQPWQAAWLIATADGREGFVPPRCGVGAGWLAARLAEERSAG